MTRILIAATLAIAAAGQAFAADLPPAAAPPRAPAAYVPAVAPTYNWGGVYIGVNGGYGFGRVNWSDPNPPAASGNFNSQGGFIGGTLGGNFQASAFVFGIEGDLDWSGINGSASNTFCNITSNCQTGNTWLSTVRGRLGVAADRVLLYGTAGGAFGNVQSTANGITETSTKTGWTAGAGIEVAFTENLTGKIEYLYVNFGNATCTTACLSPPLLPSTFGLTENLIRAGINFKFGGGG